MFQRKPIDKIARSAGRLVLERAPEGFDALVVADALRKRGGRGLIIAREDQRAAAFAAAVRFFAPDLEILKLPAWDCQPYDRVSPSPAIAAERAAGVRRLAQADGTRPLLVVATVGAIIQRMAPGRVAASAGIVAKPGDSLDIDRLKAYFAANGYTRASAVAEPGDFAVRGGVVDVFPPGAEEPIRLDLFGDTLETIRSFAPDTQRTTRTLASVDLAPVSEALLDEASIARFRQGFVAAFGGAAHGDPIYAAVSAGQRAHGMEHLLPLFHERLDTAFAAIGADPLVFLDHLAEKAIHERLEAIADAYQARRDAQGATGSAAFAAPAYRALPPEALYVSEKEVKTAFAGMAIRAFSPFAADEPGEKVDLGARPGREFAAERKSEGVNVFEAAARHVDALRTAGKRVLFASWTEGSSERNGGVLADHGVSPILPVGSWTDAISLPKGAVARVVLPLERGFETDEVAVVSEQDVLGDRLTRPRRRRAANFIAEATALAPGDLVVHVDHGVGRYKGLRTLEVAGAAHDCLELEYAGESRLYLPVENIDLLTRYGADEGQAVLDRLGGAQWQARKARAKANLLAMAGQLIEIAAKRAVREVAPSPAPSGAYDEFCARFPYAETEDQLSAIDDAINDLASGRPMDRLICGDVGFGKTEVALRAAFVAAMGGRQVAVVTPTTLLSRQHFKTFSERFRGWPLCVGQLSRLVSAKDAAAIREELAKGTCDVVVGTHALLAKSVTFRDLGLLIVDEEQHFGVKHKERLKELRADVHVLTLTATPIPRTLQMSLAGIRDLSIIATPPIDRLAVRTYVSPFDVVTVREALLREKYRGGQSFFVCPRIKDLPDAAEMLAARTPELRVITAHGQMAAGQLEEVMTAFYEGRYDVLLSTPIVESGLDIPTANTLIVHRADMFGLAQLYQLRGRVGRSKIRAYAYLTIPADWTITPAAKKRLEVLQSLDTLGAGFTLASHDLDLRGGGNLLGEEQSGHIKDVGVELFQQMLEDAVGSLRAEPGAQSDRDWSPQINVGVSVLIPEDYVADLDLRLGLYRRLAGLNEAEEREAFAAELIDRFGPLPVEVSHLMQVVEIKALCRRAGAAKVDAGPRGAVIAFRPGAIADPAPLVALVARHGGQMKLRPDETLFVGGDWPTPEARMKGARAALARIVEALTKSPQAA